MTPSNYKQAVAIMLEHSLGCRQCIAAERPKFISTALLCPKGRTLLFQMQEFWVRENS